MVYRRELWRIISGSEVRFICNITAEWELGSQRLLVSQLLERRWTVGPESCQL
jgi:hypothetical protein